LIRNLGILRCLTQMRPLALMAAAFTLANRHMQTKMSLSNSPSLSSIPKMVVAVRINSIRPG